MEETIWMKIRHTFAWGYDKWWYLEIPTDWEEHGYSAHDYAKKNRAQYYTEEYALGEFLRDEYDVGEDKSWSDKYRGFEYHKIDGLPPFEVIKAKLDRCKRLAKHYQEETDRFQAMMDTVGEIKKEDMEL